jgi:23S rRNA pseudouridine1911/1915/1917 synthase
VTASGKDSITHYQTLQAFSGTSLLSIDLETGRTHQIRVHMSAIKHPCVGDVTYGADPTVAERLGLTRQWLHATRLTFDHPVTGESLSFSSAYPGDLQHALSVVSV